MIRNCNKKRCKRIWDKGNSKRNSLNEVTHDCTKYVLLAKFKKYFKRSYNRHSTSSCFKSLQSAWIKWFLRKFWQNERETSGTDGKVSKTKFVKRKKYTTTKLNGTLTDFGRNVYSLLLARVGRKKWNDERLTWKYEAPPQNMLPHNNQNPPPSLTPTKNVSKSTKLRLKVISHWICT